MKWKLDSRMIKKDELILNGWAVGDDLKTPLTYSVTDREGRKVPFDFTPLEREDITRMMTGKATGDRPGFDIRFPFQEEEIYCLSVTDGKTVFCAHISPAKVRAMRGKEAGFFGRLREYLDPDRFREFREVFREKGAGFFLKRTGEKVLSQGKTYDRWYKENKGKALFTETEEASRILLYACLFGKASSREEKESRNSLKAQNHASFRLLEEERELQELNSCAAGYLVLCPREGILPADAFSRIASALAAHPEAEILYGDEDLSGYPVRKLRMPFFKPDFSPALFRETDYLGDLLVFSLPFLKEKDLFSCALSSREDPGDMAAFRVKAVSQAERIFHLPEILCHGRDRKQEICYGEKLSEEEWEKILKKRKKAFDLADREAGRSKIVRNTLPGEIPGSLRTRWLIEGNPRVSVLIPTKDHKDDLLLAVNSLLEKSSWQNFEILILENNSTEEETFACYRELEKRDPRIRVLTWESGFNFAAINNFGAAAAAGDYLLFMNNDVELVTPDLLEEMLGWAQQKEVGAVGARLLFPDGTLQHAGVFIGMSGLADHGLQGYTGKEPGLHFRPLLAQDLTAVTAACLMMRKSVFEEVGGYDEAFQVAFNDTDLCMKIRKAGYRIVYTPHAVMYHYESKSRGLDAAPEKRERLNREIARFRQKWGEELEAGDPFYNPNLTLLRQDFSLKEETEE